MANNAGPKTAARTALRPLLFGLLLLPALIPLLQGTALPCTHDNIFHSYRIVAMRDMLRHGWLFSRWVRILPWAMGIRSSATAERSLTCRRSSLPDRSSIAACARAALFDEPCLRSVGRLRTRSRPIWRACRLGSRSGYGHSPYLLMDALRRGNLLRVDWVGVSAWLFVTTRRIILHRRRSDVVVTVLLLVALFLSHNITSLLLAPFLGAYVLLMAWLYRDRGGWPYAFAAVGLAVLLTAWFWLPALTEQDYAQLHLSRTTT